MIPRLYTKFHSHPLLIPILSQDYTHWTPSHIMKTPNQGFWLSVVHVQRICIRFVRQDLTCVRSGDFGICLLIWVCFFNDSRRSTFYTFLYVSFVQETHDVCSFLISLMSSQCIIVLTWHLSPWLSPFFIRLNNWDGGYWTRWKPRKNAHLETLWFPNPHQT